MDPSPNNQLTQHSEALRRLARSLVGGSGPWEDLVQGTYLAALERPANSISRAWLTRVLRNRAHDHHRRRRLARLDSDSNDGLVQSSEILEASEIAQRIEEHARLVAAVEALDEPYRSTIVLRYFDDLTPAAIATRLTLPAILGACALAWGMAQVERGQDD